MKHRHHRDADPVRATGWLTTFNDMMTLIMVFFVLLFTMGSMDVKKVKRFQNSLQSALGVLHEGKKTSVAVVEPERNRNLSAKQETQEVETAPLEVSAPQADAQDPAVGEESRTLSTLEEKIGTLEMEMGIEATYTRKGIFLSLNEGLLFDLGRAGINPKGKTVLKRIGDVINAHANLIRVEGHTDNLPINTDRFPSNWELSTARAVNVVKFFVDSVSIDPQRLSAVGYGESKPKFSNDTVADRSKNRRVEIVLGRIRENEVNR